MKPRTVQHRRQEARHLLPLPRPADPHPGHHPRRGPVRGRPRRDQAEAHRAAATRPQWGRAEAPAADDRRRIKEDADPRWKLLDEIIATSNQLFAGEEFRDDQERSWIESLVAALRTDQDLVEQAGANTEAQFLASPTLRDAVTLAVAETQGAHHRMTDIFHSRGGVEVTVVESLGRLLYLDLTSAAGSSRAR